MQRVTEGHHEASKVVPLSNGAFAVPTLLGNPQMNVEELRDLEAGYRSQLWSA
jgi:hypothetical protein